MSRIRYMLLIGTAVTAQPAVAQTDGPAPPAAPAPTPDQKAATGQKGGIEDIVITAQRSEQNVQKAPLTIQVLGADQVRKSGITSVADISKLTTGLEIGTGGSSTQIFIRGVGDFSFNPLSNPGVAFNVDGVYLARPDGLAGNLYDVSRVEVLKGPQGTLYGRNANGGSINVITNDAEIGRLGGTVNIEAGNYQLIHTSGAINLPLGDNLAVRAAFNVAHRDGYLSDGTSDEIQQSGRLRLKWEPSSDVTIRLNADFTHIGGNNGGYTYLPRRPGADPWEGVGSPEAVAYRTSFGPLGPLLDPTFPDTHINTNIWGVSGQLDWKLGFATLTVLPTYRDTNVESLSFPGFYFDQPNHAKQKSLEVRLGKTTPALTWVVGGYLFRETENGKSIIYESDIIQKTTFTYLPTTTAYAAFGQATLKVFDGLRLIGGARYTSERRTLDGVYFDNRPVPFGPGPGTILERFPGKANFSAVTYKAGVEYDVTPQNMVFFTSSNGFKAGGLNETVPPAATYKPEKLASLEFGSRNRFFNNRLQINFGLYRWKYKALQDTRVTFDPLGLVNLLVVNVGDATIKGATADIVIKPTNADTLSFSGEYASSRYDSFKVQIPTAVFLPGSLGCPTTQVGSNTVGDCAGLQVARVPRWTGSVNYAHVFTFADGATVTANGSMKFSSSRWIATDFIPAERAPAYSVFDANLTYSPESKNYSVGAFVRNIGQAAYYTGGFEHPFLPGLFAANIAPPRTFGVFATFNFGER